MDNKSLTIGQGWQKIKKGAITAHAFLEIVKKLLNLLKNLVIKAPKLNIHKVLYEQLEQLKVQIWQTLTKKYWLCRGTHIKVKSKWNYLYRAVDKEGETVDGTVANIMKKLSILVLNIFSYVGEIYAFVR